MIGNSIPEYVFIRASIAGIRLIAPASVLYLALSAYAGSFILSPILGVLAIAEASFYLFVYLPRRRRLQEPPTYKPPPLTKPEREALFKKCCANLDATHDMPYPKGWFLPKRTGQELKLRRQDVENWLLWALFSSEDVQEEWKEELDVYIETIARLLGETLEDDTGMSDMKTMRLTVDPVKMTHRPLAWYSTVCVVDTMTSLGLLYLGFKHYSSTSRWFQTFPPRPLLSLFSKHSDLTPDILLPYWYRPHKSSTKLPILFLHGIGIGLYPYLAFIRDLIAADPDVGIILIELLPISMHMTTHPVPPAPLLASALNNILDTLNIPRVVLAAHSYSTFVSACILHDSFTSHPISPCDSRSDVTLSPGSHPILSKLAHTILIDPIPVLLHLPPVAFNFLYRSPSAAAEWQLWYFASTDPDVARTLGRAFFWTEGVAWAEDMQKWMRAEDDERSDKDVVHAAINGNIVSGPQAAGAATRKRGRNLAMVLAGKDQIIPAENIRRYLTGSPKASARWVGRGWADWDQASLNTAETDGRNSVSDEFAAAAQSGSITITPGVVIEEGRKAEGGGDLEVLFYPGLDHATVFDTRERREAMLDVLERFVRDV
ncbi:hypothetical protein FPV67DRAFT_1502693 [Lyophyllum atratum]|nr:hypothetical protein FPV67DRAFT_1502693 [Lyophyllum atratum]